MRRRVKLNSFPFFSLQTTTNLSSPIIWNDVSLASGAGMANLPMTNSQQFFRLTEMTPIFQFAIFYNINMEISPGGAMDINGPVFCNQGIWAAASSLTFSSSVIAAGLISTNYLSPGDPFMTPGSKASSGYPTFKVPPISGAGILNFPIFGTNNDPASIEALLQLPPMPLGSATAYSPTGQVYFVNQAELVITNSPSGGNLQVFYQNSNNVPALTLVPMDQTNFYSFVSSTNFYDYREDKIVQAIFLNVTNLNTWLTNTSALGGSGFNNLNITDTGNGINSIFIYNSIPMTFSSLTGVQVGKGQQLPPWGLTIVTPDALYTVGNFNSQTSAGNDAGQNATTYTEPAALYADAITVLSANWLDSSNTGSGIYAILSNRIAVSTTINAAVLEGIVPSSGTNYSGGVENFLRLQENWGPEATLTYNGSIVVMFPSQYASNIWNGSVFGVPERKWAFDLNFTNQTGLPPLTPSVLNYVTP
jgi:hypothetical protein